MVEDWAAEVTASEAVDGVGGGGGTEITMKGMD